MIEDAINTVDPGWCPWPMAISTVPRWLWWEIQMLSASAQSR